MAFNWNFNADDYQEMSFEPVPVGDHRVRIEDAEEQVSQSSGNQMIKLTLKASGCLSKLFHYLVFMPDKPELTNQKLGEVFESFGITPGNLNIETWKGRVGGCRVKHEIYEGEPKAKISYFLTRPKQENLPPWSEEVKKDDNNMTSIRDGKDIAPF